MCESLIEVTMFSKEDLSQESPNENHMEPARKQ